MEAWRQALRALSLEGGLGVWALGFVAGLLGGYAVIAFRFAIDAVSLIAFGVGEQRVISAADHLAAGRVWLAPILGGAAAGAVLYFARKRGWLPQGRALGVAEVIEARTLTRGDIPAGGALASAAVAAVSLGCGASAGREGPAVHFGAAIASAIARRFRLSARDARTLLACGAAAAVSASFNAPIAGVLFALEVVLGHYALSVFGPVTLASVTAAVVTRIHLGDFPAFVVPGHELASFAELPAALALGAWTGGVAILLLIAIRFASGTALDLTGRLKVAPELLPALGGVILGVIAVLIPEILGVGYEATDAALNGQFELQALIGLLLAKIVATALTLGCRFGGGVFAPALYLGAMAGGAFGIALETAAPFETAGPAFYAIIGMGALSGAVLGAPISTTLIVFELTGDYQMTIALLLSVSMARWIAQAGFAHRSFFHWQLAERGYDLSEGPQGVILHTIRVRDVMDAMPGGGAPLPEDAQRLQTGQTLEAALARLSETDGDGLPVVTDDEQDKVAGYLSYRKALAAYNKALLDAFIEEHK